MDAPARASTAGERRALVAARFARLRERACSFSSHPPAACHRTTAPIQLGIGDANVQRSICNLEIRNSSNQIAALWLATRMNGRCCFASRPRLPEGCSRNATAVVYPARSSLPPAPGAPPHATAHGRRVGARKRAGASRRETTARLRRAIGLCTLPR